MAESTPVGEWVVPVKGKSFTFGGPPSPIIHQTDKSTTNPPDGQIRSRQAPAGAARFHRRCGGGLVHCGGGRVVHRRDGDQLLPGRGPPYGFPPVFRGCRGFAHETSDCGAAVVFLKGLLSMLTETIWNPDSPDTFPGGEPPEGPFRRWPSFQQIPSKHGSKQEMSRCSSLGWSQPPLLHGLMC